MGERVTVEGTVENVIFHTLPGEWQKKDKC